MTSTTAVTNELQLIESKEVRDSYIEKVDVLNKVKVLVMLSNDTIVTTEMVANYYEVPIGTIKSLISEHNSELIEDGYKILKGNDLKDFKGELGNPTDLKFLSSMAIIPKRAVLRIGMLLRDSEIAKAIRTHLLNINQLSTVEQNNISFKMMEEMSNKITVTNDLLAHITNSFENLYNENKLLNQKVSDLERVITNQGIMMNSNVIEFNQDIIEMRYKIDELYDVLRIPENDKKAFSKLRYIFGDKFNITSDVMQYVELYNALSNWFDIVIVKTDKVCKRDFIINNKGIDMVREFITGIQLNRIIKNKNGNWIDLGGYKSNTIEWERTKQQFNHECAYCGKTGATLYPEHMLPQSHKMTTNEIWNILPSCGECNKDKNNQTVMKWYPQQTFSTSERQDKIADHVNKYITKDIIV